MKLLANVTLSSLMLATLYCLYAAFHFHTLQVISTPEQIPRVQYNRNVYLAGFAIAAALWALTHVLVRKKR